MFCQERDVAGPFSQGRAGDGHNVQSVIEILAEFSFSHQFRQVFICSSDHSHVDFAGQSAAHPFKFAFLDHAQNFGLGCWFHIADLIQEQSAAISFLQLAFLTGISPGERSFFEAKKLAFDQFTRNRRTIELRKGFVRARTAHMDQAGDQFFTGAAFAHDQDLGIAGSYPVDEMV